MVRVAGFLLTRVVVGSTKRQTVSYQTDTGTQLKNQDAVEAFLVKRVIDITDEVRKELKKLNFDPNVACEEEDESNEQKESGETGAGDSNERIAAGAANSGDKADAESEPEYKRRNREIAQSRAAAFARGSG
jgi:hypothetical protein